LNLREETAKINSAITSLRQKKKKKGKKREKKKV